MPNSLVDVISEKAEALVGGRPTGENYGMGGRGS
jgi:hypothetical protein